MKMINDYKCDTCGVTTEHWVEPTADIKCIVCDEIQTKVLSGGSFILDPLSGHFPSATQQWAKNRDIKIKQEQKVEANHGVQPW